MKLSLKEILWAICAMLLALVVINYYTSTPPSHPILDTAAQENAYTQLPPAEEELRQETPYSTLIKKAEAGKVAGAVIHETPSGERVIIARLKTGEITKTSILPDEALLQDLLVTLKADDVPVSFQKEASGILASILPGLVVLGILLVIYFLVNGYISRGLAGGRKKDSSQMEIPENETKSPLKKEVNPQTRLRDVGGINHIRDKLEEVIAKILSESNRGYLGGEADKGYLFIGPPGTGKTLLAQAIAGEVARGRTDGKDVTFFYVSASDFVEKFVGQGAANIRAMFEEIAQNTPCIIFIDELDAIGKRRDGSNSGGGDDERNQTINQLLSSMGGFDDNPGVTFIAATNRPGNIDDALLRPGRFSRKISIPLPDLVGREEILRIHATRLRRKAMMNQIARKIMAGEETSTVAAQILSGEVTVEDSELPEIFATDVDFNIVARETPGCSGVELKNVLERAAEIAEAEELSAISIANIRNAYQALRMGDEMPREFDIEDEFAIAVHEILGHAVIMAQNRIAFGKHHADNIMSMTIIPRGDALGFVWLAPPKDRVTQSRKYLLGRVCQTMGGQIAEKLYLGSDHVTAGASSDVNAATDIVRKMVSECAMIDAKGLTFRNYMEPNGYGLTKAQAELVDAEIDRVLEDQYRRALAIILSFSEARDNDGNNLLEMLARAMLVKKTLQGEEFMRLLEGEIVFPRQELDLGEQEAAFCDLWQRYAASRKDAVLSLRENHPQIASEYGL